VKERKNRNMKKH